MIEMKKLPILICAFLFVPLSVCAQGFSSGSTGADGALDLSSMNCPDNLCVVQLPESGILNYTTVNVPAGSTLRFKVNSRNTPVIMLAQGNVTINGTLDVSSIGYYLCGTLTTAQIGPGGFRGGQPGHSGFGPGGGVYCADGSCTPNGSWVGPLSLVPIVGGSGGAGRQDPFAAWAGGDGGGAITIASSTSVFGSGSMQARGSANGNCSNGGWIGSGGAIRLVSNTVNFSGNFNACSLNCGVVRIEATSLTFTGSSSPAAVLSPINPAIYSSALPQLTISSIGGFAVPSYAGSRFDTVDLLLPSQLSDPINVSVHATNIPLGTQVGVGFVTGSSQATSTPGTLSGAFESSIATCTISGLNRNQVTYLLATAIFDPPAGAMNFNPKGPDRVAKMRIESVIGAKPKFAFLRSNGTVIDQAKLPKAFLQQLGL